MAGAAAGCARMTRAATSTSSTRPWGASRLSASSTTHAAERSVAKNSIFWEKYLLFRSTRPRPSVWWVKRIVSLSVRLWPARRSASTSVKSPETVDTTSTLRVRSYTINRTFSIIYFPSQRRSLAPRTRQTWSRPGDRSPSPGWQVGAGDCSYPGQVCPH